MIDETELTMIIIKHIPDIPTELALVIAKEIIEEIRERLE